MRLMNYVEKDLKNLVVFKLKTMAQERGGWRRILEQAKTHKEL
jgi:hypothetical protein